MICLALLASLAVVTVTQDTSESETTRLEFGWPDEGRVAVYEKVLKKTSRAELRYDLSWAPLEEGEGRRVEYRNFRFLTVNGMNASDPRIASALVQAQAMAGVIPKLQIDVRGNLVGFSGFDEAIDGVLGLLEGKVERSTLKALREAMSQPQVRQTIEAKTAETWNYWVGNWVDLELQRGTEDVWEIDMEESGGTVPELFLVYGDRKRHRGADCVEISMKGTANEDMLRRRLLEMMGVFAEGLDTELPDDLPVDRATKVLTVNGIYAVDGLRPLEAHTSDVTRLWITGANEPQEQIEEHSYYFDWPGVEPHGERESSKRSFISKD